MASICPGLTSRLTFRTNSFGSSCFPFWRRRCTNRGMVIGTASGIDHCGTGADIVASETRTATGAIER